MHPITNQPVSFAGQQFYIGLDVHKKSWTVTIRTLGLEVAHFNQAPDPQHLANFLTTRFSEGSFFSAYEAGFCGISPHLSLTDLGIKNIVINAADLPQTDKQKKSKTDQHDSRAIARYLEKGLLSCIHIMPIDQQERRALYRCREAIVKDTTRAVNRIRSLLYLFGVEVPEGFRDKQCISKNFLTGLTNIKLSTVEGSETLRLYLDDLQYHRKKVLAITEQLKKSVSNYYNESYFSLLAVPGIGPITAIGLLTETGDLSRFNNPDEYTSYLGLVPAEQRTGDTLYSVSLQPRCNMHLRPLLIEAAWFAIRRCPTLLSYYRKHAARNNKKAIVKVARKLALIAKSVAINKGKYRPDFLVAL